MDRDALDLALVKAHDGDDKAALVRLYTAAADDADRRHDINAACFFLTHAFVFALETGAPEAAALNKRLAEHGRVKPLEV